MQTFKGVMYKLLNDVIGILKFIGIGLYCLPGYFMVQFSLGIMDIVKLVYNHPYYSVPILITWSLVFGLASAFWLVMLSIWITMNNPIRVEQAILFMASFAGKGYQNMTNMGTKQYAYAA